MPDLPYCHIYPQDDWHHPVAVVGDASAISAIWDACEQALTGGGGETLLFTNDHEGYRLRVLVSPVAELPLPYFAEHARDSDAAAWSRLRVALGDVGSRTFSSELSDTEAQGMGSKAAGRFVWIARRTLFGRLVAAIPQPGPTYAIASGTP